MLPLILLSHIALSIAAPSPVCDPDKIAIAGGEYTVTDGGNVKSRVEYTCPEGMYPHPVLSRECQRNGHWTDEKLKAQCKAIHCPRPITFENGDFHPRKAKYFTGDVLQFECWEGYKMYGPENRTCQADGKWSGDETICDDQAIQCPRPIMFENGDFHPRKAKYFTGDVLQFECWDGYKMYGPENRTCQGNGKWSGDETICDDQDGDCPNPGIPIGASKFGFSYKIESKVTYECGPGLTMYGSKERICVENKRWSGAEPTCRYSYTYDTPKEVVETFSVSFFETVVSPHLEKVKEDADRKIRVEKDSLMNIFIVIDASKRVGERNFRTAQNISEIFIEKMASFDIVPRYAVISYASYVKPIVQLSDGESTDAEKVIERIQKVKYSEHGDKQGRNTRAALNEIYKIMSLEQARDATKFLLKRNVILLMTYGKTNMGEDPTAEVKRIRELLDIKKDNNREDFLDIYVFGLGDVVCDDEINGIASKKAGKKHVFKMRNIDDMKKAFLELEA
ncbi:complement factor B-like [Dendropsophus ebraccatus]|uniref:complement factor B-like n=1 Tax=Dendropsophus ebraccatus TaxID=150705 RepID=UPI003831363E